MKSAYKPLSIFSIALLVSAAVQAPAYAHEEPAAVPTSHLVATYRPADTDMRIKCAVSTSGLTSCVQDTSLPSR